MEEGTFASAFAFACDDGDEEDEEFDFFEEKPKPEGNREVSGDEKYLSNYLLAFQEDEEESDRQEEPDNANTGTARSIFEILESDEILEEEQQDPLISNIHSAVKATMMSLPSMKRLSVPLKSGNVRNTAMKTSKTVEQSHRSAEMMKDFAINLSPHTYMVLTHSVYS